MYSRSLISSYFLQNYSQDNSPFLNFSSPWSNQSIFSPSKQHYDYGDNYLSSELFPKSDNVFDFNNNKSAPIDHFKEMDAAVKTLDSPNYDLFSSCESAYTLKSAFGTPPTNSYSSQVTSDSPLSSLFSFSNQSSPGRCSNSDTDFYGGIYGESHWNTDSDLVKSTFSGVYKNEYSDSFYANVPEKQIETILQEALEALVLNKCDENDQHQFFL